MRMGIDLGGTKIEGVVLDEQGVELARWRQPTPHDGYESTVEMVVGLVAELERQCGARCSVGIGTPGAISPASGLMKNANNNNVIGHPLDRDLQTRLGRPVRIANDANCFALSEAVDGAAAGASIVFGVIVGTGCGGGVVVDRRVLTGANAIAGEWGHNPLPWPRPAEELPGPPCSCGRHGDVESFLSGPGLVRDFEQAAGRRLEPPAVVAAAEAGDTQAEAALQRYEDRMARALAAVINLIDPHVIVLGGGMSNVARLYANVPQRWAEYVFSDRVDNRLVPPKYGDASGVRGAAWLWPPQDP